ncbi:hypothetical protein GUJ93_ZPchr0013g35979 [Zizania palustris]|uniref:Uncharacterized protein n=1 Tax=Zizania palustris TaxID=103762 RepID=A0A8J5WRX5_ZIZPA|nr:hypothetical protein GUJ93_ZPchr0013g35979 [Zizania palustris]
MWMKLLMVFTATSGARTKQIDVGLAEVLAVVGLPGVDAAVVDVVMGLPELKALAEVLISHPDVVRKFYLTLGIQTSKVILYHRGQSTIYRNFVKVQNHKAAKNYSISTILLFEMSLRGLLDLLEF